MKLLALAFLPCILIAQPAILQTHAPIPANLSVFANQGDKTYCVVTPQRAVGRFTISCRRGGVFKFTSQLVTESLVFNVGDLCWILDYDPVNPKLVHFQVAANIRQNGQVSGNFMASRGDVLWP